MIFIGKILKVRGNKGEVVITSPTVKVRTFTGREIVSLKSEKYEKKCEVEFLKEISGNPVLKLKGIDSITEALKLVGYSVYAVTDEKGNSIDNRDENDDEPQLEGFSVRDVNGDLWGQVIYFEADSVNKLLEIQGEKETDVYYVPFTDTIIKQIDEEKRLIIIDPPDGLKSLNEK